MKLSVSSPSAVLLLSVLLALLVVSHGQKKSPNIKDQPVNSDQNSRGPQTSSNTLVSIHRRNQPEEYKYMTMEWEKFEGTVPKDAVSIRGEGNMYVCRNMEKKCAVGILIESKCEYEEDENVKIDNPGSFEVLVNKDDFDSLEWKKIKCTAEVEEVHKNAVLICDDQNLFVGSKRGEAKSLPAERSALRKSVEESVLIKPLRRTKVIKGLETVFGSCMVLTVSYDNIKDQDITDCEYDEKNQKESEFILPEQASDTSVTVNKENTEVTQIVQYSRTISRERRWDFTYAVSYGVKLNIGLKTPKTFSMGIEISRQTTTTEKTGFSVKQDKTFSTPVHVKVQPKSKCTVRVVGQQHMVKIPFKAKLIRRFKRGDPKTKIVSGTFVANDAVDVKTVIEKCEPLDGNVASAGGSASNPRKKLKID